MSIGKSDPKTQDTVQALIACARECRHCAQACQDEEEACRHCAEVCRNQAEALA